LEGKKKGEKEKRKKGKERKEKKKVKSKKSNFHKLLQWQRKSQSIHAKKTLQLEHRQGTLKLLLIVKINE